MAPAEPPPAPWYTEEMVDAAAKRFAFDDWPTRDWDETVSDWWEERKEGYRRRVRRMLDAIAPMVTKWVGDLQASEGEMMRQAGYKAGYKAGRESRPQADPNHDYNREYFCRTHRSWFCVTRHRS